MINIDFVDLVNAIPSILQLFVPGVIFIKIFSFSTTPKKNDPSLHMIYSVVISCVVIAFTQLVISSVFPKTILSFWILVFLYIVVSAILAVLASLLHENKAFNKFIEKINHKSINDNLWSDNLDYDLGTSVKVFLRGRDVLYIGELVEHEENGNDSWIVLSDYLSCNPLTEKVYYNSLKDKKITRVMINQRDVDRIELFYRDETKIFD